MNVLKLVAALIAATAVSATAFAAPAPAVQTPAQPTVDAKRDATAKPIKTAKRVVKHKRHTVRSTT